MATENLGTIETETIGNEATFESTAVFSDDPPAPKELTPEEEYDKSFAEASETLPEEPPGDDAQAKRIYEVMSDDELKDVFEKAKRFDELNDRLNKTHKDAFGRIGGLEQVVKELKSRPEPQAVQVTKDQFKNLAGYLGEDDEMLDALTKDLSALQLGIPLTPNLNVEFKFEEERAKLAAEQQAFEQRMADMQRSIEVRLLSVQHPDWEEFNNVPEKAKEFVDWQLTLKPEDRQALEQASLNWDARTLANALTKFKGWKAKKAEFEQQKQQRLEGSIPPTRGNGHFRPPPNLDNDYEAGFKAGLMGQ